MKRTNDYIIDPDLATFGQFLDKLNGIIRQNAAPDDRTAEEIEAMLDKGRQNTLQLFMVGKITSDMAKEMLENIAQTREILDEIDKD